MAPKPSLAPRFPALDALRGISILGMVFSGMMPRDGYWPGWMYHAQVGPPDFSFHPTVPGITWVDLVFPFFLFAMGMAIPLSLHRKIENIGWSPVVAQVVKRSFLLLVFAIAIKHLGPYGLAATPWVNQLSGILAFVGFFLLFGQFPNFSKWWTPWLGFLLLLGLVVGHALFSHSAIDLYRSDIIILILANMALFGSGVWMATRDYPVARVFILFAFAGVWLTHDIKGSWTQLVWDFHPQIHWLYQFSWLKYLFIVLAGTWVAEYLLKHPFKSGSKITATEALLALLAISLLAVNLYGLYTRHLWVVLVGSFLLLGAGAGLVVFGHLPDRSTYRYLWLWTALWWGVGMAFEPLDGGIKKDPSSFSYWMVTAGLSICSLLLCHVGHKALASWKAWHWLLGTGKNPMMAYVAGAFLLLPILDLFALSSLWEWARQWHPILGLAKPILVTVGVMALATYFSKRTIYWKS
jgi:predicted acyltransferase